MDVYYRMLLYSRIVKHWTPGAIMTRAAVNLSYKLEAQPDHEPPDLLPPLIICHSLLGTKDSWKSLGKTIHTVTKRVVVRIDLRNHGVSPQTKSHKYEEQAADILQLMKKLELPRASLVGHNMGGRTAMCVALMEPSAVSSLIVLDMSPVSTSPEFSTFFPKLMDAMTEVKWKEKKKVHKARKEIKEQLKNVVQNEVIMKHVLSNINIRSDGTIGWTCNLETLIRHFRYISSFPLRLLKGRKYYGPTLFIGGQHSEYIPPDDLPRIRELFPQAVVEFVPGAGHFVHKDEPKAVLELAISFLNDPKNNEVDLAHNVYGKSESGGPPVVILHGLLGSKRNWAGMSQKISSTCHRMVVTADIRNHGESPHESSHTYHELAADVGKLIDSLSLKEADVIGHSMGGRTSMALALLEPMKVHSLIIVDISPVSTAGVLNEFFPVLIDNMKAIDFQGKASVSDAKNFAKEKLLNSGLFQGPGSVQFILMNIGNRGGQIGWMCNLDALKSHFMDIANFPDDLKSKQYQGPVLFIGGSNSNYLPRDDITGIRSMFPKAELKYVEGVGHNVHAEDPTGFFNLVNEFLSANK